MRIILNIDDHDTQCNNLLSSSNVFLLPLLGKYWMKMFPFLYNLNLKISNALEISKKIF